MLQVRHILPWLFAAAAVLSPSTTSELYGRAHGPKGRLMTARPALIWEVWSTDPREIVGARAVVDDKSIPASYDAVSRRVIAQPGSALRPGEHTATLYAVMRDGGTIKKSWSFEIAPNALGSLPPPNESQYKTLDIINRFRSQMGLAPAKMDLSLNASSLLHSRYHAANGTTGHYQDPKKPGFIGQEPWERHEALGWVGDSWETVEYGSEDEEEAIQSLIDAPYHRLPYMQPGEIFIGSGYTKNRMAVAFSMSRATSTVIYPVDRQMDVPILWDCIERPNPFRIHPGARRPVGYPIMLAHFTGDEVRLAVRSARLFDEQGEDISCFLNTPSNDGELTNALILMPKAPLQAESWYTVRVEAAVQGGPDVSRVWRFRTVSRAAAARQRSGSKASAKRP